MKKHITTLNGYRLIYKPEHKSSMTNECWKGYVYEHRYVMEIYLNRVLAVNEIVHHLDGDRSNNRIENLIVLSKEMHAKLHMWIDAGAFICESYKMNGMNSKKSKVTIPTYCIVCGETLQGKHKKTCSLECYKKHTSRNIPNIIDLKNSINTMSFVDIGKKYSVSDNTVRKWARKYELL